VTDDRWTAADDYIDARLAPADPVLDAALQAAADGGLPAISVSPSQGKLLHVLALGLGARKILEIGTLGGYSTIWLGRALPPGGRLITLEVNPHHADVARSNLARAGLDEVTEVRVGRAQDTLPAIAAAGEGPFDLIFIDADKAGYPGYLEWSLRLSRSGTMILADNVVRGGEIADPESSDEAVIGVQQFIEALSAEPRVSAAAIQTVGRKGYDGFALAVVRG
jgi:predicted O-methyltransferase YrrM